MLNSYHRNRILLAASVIASFLLFRGAGRLFSIPAEPGFSASLLQQPSPTVTLLIVAVVLIVSLLVSTLIAGRIRFDAGLFGAVLGLSALSLRGGPMRYVLMDALSRDVYLAMVLELILLYGIVVLAWSMLWLLHRNNWLQADVFRDGVEDVDDPMSQKLMAAFTQCVAMMMAMALLARTDDKKQVLAAVGLSSMAATMVAYHLFPVRPSVWYWIGPMYVGIFGYLAAWFRPEHWMIGQVSRALATPLPLDYASFGPAGALVGYWISRKWQRAKDVAAEAEAETTTTRPKSTSNAQATSR
jgi:hypothetical protein